MDAFETLLQYDDLFTTVNNPFLYPLRFLGWWILRILAMLITAVEQAVNTLFQNIDFFNSPEASALFQQLKPVAWGLMLIGILLLFYSLMTNRLKSKAQIPFNFICFFIIMIGLPSFLSELNSLTNTGIDTFKNTSEATMAQTVMDNAVQDLYYYDQNNFSPEALENHNAIPTDKIEFINPVEQIRPENCQNPDVFGNQLGIDSNGNYQLTQLGDGMFGWELLSSYYYRYKIDWIPLFISLIAMLVAFVFSAIKIAKITFELAYNVYVLLFVSAVDMTSGERTKRVCSEILSLFLVLVAIAAMFRVYIIGVSWVSHTFEGLAQAFAMFGFSWALIDGPNIIQKLFGIDAGLSSAFHTFMGVYNSARAAAGITKGAMHAAKAGMHMAPKVAGGAAVAAAATGGFAAGKIKGIHDYVKEKQEAAKNQGRAGPVHSYSSFDRAALNSGAQTPKLSDGKSNGKPGNNNHGQNTGGGQPQYTESDLKNGSFADKSSAQNVENQSEHFEAGTEKRSQTDMPNSAEQQATAASSTEVTAKNEQPNERKKRVPDRTTTFGSLIKGTAKQGFNKTSDKMQNSVLTKSYDISRNTTVAGLHKRDEVFQHFKNKLDSAYQSPQHQNRQSKSLLKVKEGKNGRNQPKS